MFIQLVFLFLLFPRILGSRECQQNTTAANPPNTSPVHRFLYHQKQTKPKIFLEILRFGPYGWILHLCFRSTLQQLLLIFALFSLSLCVCLSSCLVFFCFLYILLFAAKFSRFSIFLSLFLTCCLLPLHFSFASSSSTCCALLLPKKEFVAFVSWLTNFRHVIVGVFNALLLLNPCDCYVTLLVTYFC